jgi:hypothetical protein
VIAGGGVSRAAPTRFAAPTKLAPAQIVRRELAAFGDRRYVTNAVIAPVPRLALEHLRGYFAGKRPPHNAVWAYLAAPRAGRSDVAQWETDLFAGGLRDAFCAAGGAPLVGYSVGGHVANVSDHSQAFGQRFPNPSPAAFRARAALIGRRYGFRVVSLRLLHPLQTAPLLVVETTRDRKPFVHDVPAIMDLLDPRNGTALTFEGFLFEARDDKGAFVRVENVYRGEVMGGEWSWSRCDYPYAHSEPFGAKPCPS